MTYFLNDTGDMSAVKPRGPDAQPSGVWEGLGAAFNKASLENDANFRLSRERRTGKEDLAARAMSVIGSDAVGAELEKRGLYTGDALPTEAIKMNPKAAEVVLEMARQRQASSPDAWADFDLSQEGIDKKVNEKLQAEYADAETILNMMPAWRGAVDLAGGMAGITADIKNLPFMLGGGGGSILRVMGREAVLNMGAEATFLPAQYEMADRLGIEDPDVLSQLAMAAGAGAVFGGAVEVGSRAFSYMRGRNRLPPTADPVFDAGAIDAAEDAIVAGENPVEAARRVQADAPPKLDPLILRDPIKREPLIPERVDEPKPAAEAQPDTLDVLTAPLSDEARQIEDASAAAISDAMAYDKGASKPLISWMTRGHRVTKAQIKAAEKNGQVAAGGENMQINPSGKAAQELRSMGVTPKTAPGLFSKQGRGDFDNLVAADMEDRFPGITAAAGLSDDGIYLDRQGFLDVIARDANGDASWLSSRADVARIVDEREAALRALENPTTRPADDYLAGRPADDGFFVDLDAYAFDDPTGGLDRIRDDFDAYFRKEWADELLTPDERLEIITELQKNGGEAKHLVERVLERDLDYGDLPKDKADDHGQYDPEEYFRYLDQSEAGRLPDEGRGDIGEPGQSAQSARGGPEGEGYDTGPQRSEVRADADSAAIRTGLTEKSFNNWFRKSVIVDEAGNPLPMYHGTNDDFEVFDVSLSGRNEKGWLGGGGYFTNRTNNARFYAENRAEKAGGVPVVKQVYLRVENPLYTDADMLSDDVIKKAINDGHDAIVMAEYSFGGERIGGFYEVVVFSDDQIKMAKRISEPTAAGEQTLIDGVAPITQRDRLEARQSAPMGGGRQSAPDSNIGGLFDPDDKVRNDLFSDPTAPQARQAQDAMRADIEDQIELGGDFSVDMDDGIGSRSASSILDEFDADDEFQAILDACGKGKST